MQIRKTPRKSCPVDCRDLLRAFCLYTSPAPLARIKKPPIMARALEYIRTCREARHKSPTQKTQTSFSKAQMMAHLQPLPIVDLLSYV